MINIHQKFCRETFYDGQLVDFQPVYKSNFNFAYDVMDVIAHAEPERRAMLWCNDKGDERTFSFKDFEILSNQAANMFLSLGIKRGDTVVLVLKRHYQFWISVLALHKIGAVAIPATNLLTKKDFVYRFNAAHVSAVICTTDGETLEHADAALPQCPTVKVMLSVKGAYKGWTDFDAELPKYSPKLDRLETKATDPMLLYFTSGTTGMPKMVWHDYTYPLGHIITAKYWHNVIPNGLHLTISDTGWMKAMWG